MKENIILTLQLKFYSKNYTYTLQEYWSLGSVDPTRRAHSVWRLLVWQATIHHQKNNPSRLLYIADSTCYFISHTFGPYGLHIFRLYCILFIKRACGQVSEWTRLHTPFPLLQPLCFMCHEMAHTGMLKTHAEPCSRGTPIPYEINFFF